MATAHVVQSLKYLGYFQPHNLHQISPLSCHTLKSLRLSHILERNYSSVKSRLYSDKHEWVEVSENIGTVGISQHAQEALGDVVYAQLPDPGTEVSQHDEVGALESVKAASELFTPVSGKVVEKNSQVEESPALINKSCYDKGWLFKISLTKPDELKELMDEDKYSQFLRSSHH